MSKFFDLSDFYSSDGSVKITENGCKNLTDLVNIVINTHYSYVNVCDRADLIQVGVLKSLSLLKDGKFDKTKSSLKNYLYTGVRNEMKNYLYKNFKEVSVDDSILCSMNESSERLDAVEDSLLIISKKECLEVLSRFETRNVGVSDKVFSSLEWLGFTIEGVVSEKRYYPDVEMLVTLLIWKHMEKYYEYKE